MPQTRFPYACQLTNRGVIRLGGEDKRTFLQGLISNDINLCTPEQAIYAALLTPQGKFLHDMFIVDAGDYFLVDCEAVRADDLIKRLSMYRLRSKVTIENLSSGHSAWAIWSENFPSALEERSDSPNEQIYADPRFSELGWRGITPKYVQLRNTEPVDFSAYDKHRLKLGIPDGSRDMIIEKSALLECNMDRLNGISWTKGCYMGQELTARTHYRGLIKKRLLPVKISGPTPEPGSLVYNGAEESGEMRSSCGDIGLALLKLETMDAADLTCNESRLAPYKPKWFVN